MQTEIIEGKVTRIPLTQLFLDPENFRLRDPDLGKSQGNLLILLERDFDLITIGMSLVDNGYFEAEPLVVVPKTQARRDFVVVEGNRKTGALKLLTDPDARAKVVQRKEWEELAQRNKNDFSVIPCVPYFSKDQVLRLVGYRHIAGVNTWDPYQKARFVDYFIGKSERNVDFKQIGREIGVGPSTARSIYITYRIFVYARDKLELDTSAFEAEFSLMRASLGNATISKFIGLKKSSRIRRILKWPVPESKAEELKELLGYIYGTKDERPVVPESRDLSDLGRVLDNKLALAQLRSNRDFEGALQLIGGWKERLVKNLAKAGIALDDSLRDAYHFKDDTEIREAWERVKAAVAQLTGVLH